MARRQVIVQLDDELVAELDRVANTEGASRSELIRRGVRALLEAGDEVEAVRELVESYRRVPQQEWIVEAGEDLAAEILPPR